jgi:hypothetical protein
MWNEDNEAVETVSTETATETAPAPEVETSEPVETIDVSASEPQEATPVAVEEEVEVPEVFDWNGEYESLHAAGWVKQLDENLRGSVLKGIQDKYQHWQRGYTSKYQELAKQRKEADELLKEVRENEIRVQRWMNGDINPMVEKQREIDEMKVAHRAALKTLRREAENAHEKATRTHGEAMEQAARERDEALQQYQQINDQFQSFETKQVETQVDALEGWLIKEHNDIYENDEAFDEFCLLAKANIPPERAMKMVRANYPSAVPEVAPEPAPAPAPEPEPEPVPEGMKLMNMGPDTAAATEGGDPRSYQEMMESMRKAAMVENELILRS